MGCFVKENVRRKAERIEDYHENAKLRNHEIGRGVILERRYRLFVIRKKGAQGVKKKIEDHHEITKPGNHEIGRGVKRRRRKTITKLRNGEITKFESFLGLSSLRAFVIRIYFCGLRVST